MLVSGLEHGPPVVEIPALQGGEDVNADPSDERVPDVVRACLTALGSQLLSLKKQILDFDRIILAWHRSDQTSKRLNCIPGVGPLLATALIASVADPKAFRSGRNFSAWIGLVPKQHSSGGRDRLGMAGHRPRCNQLWGRAEERRSHAPNNVIDQPRQIPPEPDVHSKGHSESDWGAVHRRQT